MKVLGLLLTAGLASARIHLPRQAGINNLNISSSGGSNIGVNGASSFNLADFDLGELGLDGLEVGGLNLGTVDLGNQDVIADAILAMLGGFCLGNALDRNNILSFGFNNDVDLFFQLAQLMQLEQLGFLDLGGVQSLFNNGQVLGGFNLGVFKREVSEAKKMMKRTKLRRGQKAKRQCATEGVGAGNSGAAINDNTFNIATAPPDTSATVTATADDAGFTIATVPDEEAGFTIATAPGSSVAVSTMVAASATQVAETSLASASAVAIAASDAASVATPAAEAAVSAIPAAAASVAPAAAADSVASVPAAGASAATSATAAADVPGGADDVDLADLTR
ncbi:uncharacterized protein B0H64DRAFT_375605 [Chaetomium fimeti]|uniref:Uncharacterized protein n=1 Tax=Chaetomium fimeti TaxID=1854472 RepID=A0AAE0HEL2_9PEZI|nr:hypothetical protein B0H64DRAFT_375605 [Chaetomium fimeti]